MAVSNRISWPEPKAFKCHDKPQNTKTRKLPTVPHFCIAAIRKAPTYGSIRLPGDFTQATVRIMANVRSSSGSGATHVFRSTGEYLQKEVKPVQKKKSI
jgi:hypothetical protein